MCATRFQKCPSDRICAGLDASSMPCLPMNARTGQTARATVSRPPSFCSMDPEEHASRLEQTDIHLGRLKAQGANKRIRIQNRRRCSDENRWFLIYACLGWTCFLSRSQFRLRCRQVGTLRKRGTSHPPKPRNKRRMSAPKGSTAVSLECARECDGLAMAWRTDARSFRADQRSKTSARRELTRREVGYVGTF